MFPDTLKMTKTITIMLIFIWCGLLIGISFVEAPLKFTAPNITLPLGLGIGRIVFNALNKIEISIGIGLIACYIFSKENLRTLQYLIIPLVIVGVQSFFLLPALDERAEKIIRGVEVAGSPLHYVYVILEFIKLFTLIIIGMRFIKENLK